MPTLIGYARVSTADQNPQLQLDALAEAKCDRIVHERGSGASRARPVLAKLILDLKPGDTLVVWKLDRAARSLPHLLDLIEQIRQAGAHFKCITSPIDTSSAAGTLTLQILGAVAEFERAQIVERTRAGLEAARLRGRRGGNPGLKARDPRALEIASRARRSAFIRSVITRIDDWRPIALKNRPRMSWAAVLSMVNGELPEARRFSYKSLLKHARVAVNEGLVDSEILRRSRSEAFQHIKRHPAYAPVLVALRQTPQPSLKEIAASLEAAGVRTLRGAKTWSISSVSDLVTKVRATMRTEGV